ncbi:NAD-dependent epimerase/dehydratase family protein [Photobacterium sanguinicancri]|uniref:NAD-dependent epimerase/dehydratase family protein n=1 Tax=Photobacterium sanguinicancri TaxID=875932 RepID=A0AAW7YDP8_9GAMM|nr:NAD-dependent epimerase/dehydratase family protein [Photobacterium sanguinicancri]MDO6544750.1 NAD-dependent epimerase/dehydratase family protein [Photobacterium sanguinicancri]
MTKIALFGACGEVGQHIDQALTALGYHVTRIGRRVRPELTRYVAVDLFDTASVINLCYQHDLIINAAGPASMIRDTIARVAIETHSHYVDVGGEGNVFEQLQRDMMSREYESCCVFGAGFVPGFTSLLAYIAKGKLQEVQSLELFVGGIERFTITSAEDFIASLDGDEALSGSVIKDGGIVREATKDCYESPLGTKTFIALPYLSTEHQRTAQALLIDNYAAFNLIADRQLLMTAHGEEDQKVPSLVTLSESMVKQYGTQQYCEMEARGWIADQPVTLGLQCRFNNGYRLTGLVAAFTAHQLLSEKPDSHSHGLFWLSDVIDVDSLISFLRELNLFSHWELSISPNFALEFEEGVL